MPTPADTPQHAQPTDEDLNALRNRDPDAIERWIYGKRDFIRSVLYRYADDADTAEDLLQETFLQAIRSLPSFRGDAKITTWLYSIAKNVALTRLRKTKRQSYLSGEKLERVHAASEETAPAESKPTSPAEDTVRSQEMRLLSEAMEELPESYRQIIHLRDLNELSTREVADKLGLSRVNVRVRLHRARNALRETLTPRFDTAYRAAA